MTEPVCSPVPSGRGGRGRGARPEGRRPGRRLPGAPKNKSQRESKASSVLWRSRAIRAGGETQGRGANKDQEESLAAEERRSA